MNNIALNEVPMAVYQLLRQYGQVQLEDFACVIESYCDAYESGHLTMICQEYVIIGSYAVFCSDQYQLKRYQKPKGAHIYYLPLAKISDGKIGDSCSCLGFPSGDVKKLLCLWGDDSLVSPLANLHDSLKEVAQIIETINDKAIYEQQVHCSDEEVKQIANLFIKFFKLPACSE